MLKTRDYDLWTIGTIVPPKTKAQKLARKNELKAKSTLLLTTLDKHLLKFHFIKDAKSLWKAINIRFGGNKESKKMHKTILNQQYENFVASRFEVLDKTYDSNINETITATHDIPAVGSKEQPSAWSYADDVAMITMRVKKFMKRTWRNLNLNGKEPVGFDKTKVECYNCHRRRNFARECHAPRNQGNRSADNERRVVLVETPSNALVVQDGLGGYDRSYQAEEGPTDFALMAHSSNSANSSNSENETVFEEGIAFLKYDLQVRDISIKDLKNNLEETMKEKVDLKEKLTMFEESSKNLTKLINSQMSANDKTALGYDSQLSENEMPKCEIFKTASDSSNFSNPKRNFVPTAVATKSGQVLVNAAKQNSPTSTSTARPKVNTAAIKPSMNVKSSYFKPYFPKRRHLNQRSAAKTNTFSRKINTAKGKIVITAGPKGVVNAAEGNKEIAVKTSAGCVWRPKITDLNNGNPQYTLHDQGIFDSGCSRHMTCNKSFLTDYQEINGGFVAFGGSPKGGKITGKGKIRIGKLDFEDVYFVKELKFNHFSISQMCDKKNSVLFTETECLVLSLDFKLLDESQVLLKVLR
nr:ribonuclease H-like domain-containing protein [Tanacetum cinerariifolium]